MPPPTAPASPAELAPSGLDRRAELADFLRSRRDRQTPEQAGLGALGLGSSGRRRTPGLRREEVALLAGISSTWYTWLEQGRVIRVSPAALERLVGALKLDGGERLHLFRLAGQSAPADAGLAGTGLNGTGPDGGVPAAVARFVDQLAGQPAYVLGRRWDYLSWNAAATAVFGDLGALPPPERHVLRRLFLDPARRDFYTDWAQVAAGTVARFRADSAALLDDPQLRSVIEEVRAHSPEFRQFWQRHDLRGASDGLKDLHHPQVGRLVFETLLLDLPDVPEVRVMVYTPRPDWDTPAKLKRLLGQLG